MRMNKRERNKKDKMFTIIEAGGWILGIYYTLFFFGYGPEPCGTMSLALCFHRSENIGSTSQSELFNSLTKLNYVR